MLASGKGVLLVVGVIAIIYGFMHLAAHLGHRRLPGDIPIKGKHGTVYFSIVGTIVLTAALSILIWILNRF